jgi:hypothetical protein
MKNFHVVLADELGEEFSVEVMAGHWQEAFEKVSSEYPESMVVFVKELKPYNRES